MWLLPCLASSTSYSSCHHLQILTGFFAQKSIAALDGTSDIAGGWVDHNYKQMGYQLANSTAGFAYSFVVTVREITRGSNMRPVS